MKELINPDSHYTSGRIYSKGVKVDIGDSEMLFISGQLPKDKKGEIVGRGDYTRQTEYIFEKLITILKEAGMSLNDLVKVNIYVINMDEFEKVSTVRNKYLKDLKPASTSVQIGATTTPGCDVEIDAIAIKRK
jgi:2-iminobutanoate/2-iminopropanoate deaminase